MKKFCDILQAGGKSSGKVKLSYCKWW